MQKKSITILLDEATVEALRRIAAQNGLVIRRGPGAQVKQGSIAKLLAQIAREGWNATHR